MTRQNTPVDYERIDYGFEPYGPNAGTPTITISLGSSRDDNTTVDSIYRQMDRYNWLKVVKDSNVRLKFAPQDIQGRPSDPLDSRHTEAIVATCKVLRPKNVVIETFYPSPVPSELRGTREVVMYRNKSKNFKANSATEELAREARFGRAVFLVEANVQSQVRSAYETANTLKLPKNRLWFIPEGETLKEANAAYERIQKPIRSNKGFLSPRLDLWMDYVEDPDPSLPADEAEDGD